MKNVAVVEKINQLFLNSEGEVETFNEKFPVGKFLGARMKNEGIIIFEFEQKHVGLALCISVFSTVKNETEEGFEGEVVCKDIFIGGKNFWDIIGKIVN